MKTLFKDVICIDGFMEEALRGDLLVSEGIIEKAGEVPGPDAEGAEIIRCDGKKALLPGLVNCHTHAAMTLLRGLGEERPLKEWLEERIWPVEACLTSEDIASGTASAILEMAKTGTTCFADMYFEMQEVGRVALESGMRCGLSRGIIGENEASLEDGLGLAEHFAGEDRVTIQLAPHAPYTVPLPFFKRVTAAASDHGIGIHTHFLEAPWERGQLKDDFNLDPVSFLEDSGILEAPGAILAHCVWLDPEEAARLSGTKVTIAHNPASNLKLGSGIAPVGAFLEKGASLSLGTDGAASNNRLDMWQEMRLAALVGKGVNQDPLCCTAGEVLRMATYQGARALGFENCGRILEGWSADLVLVDLDQPHYIGWEPATLGQFIVYAGSSADVQGTMVSGEWVYKDGIYPRMDAPEVIRKAGETRKSLRLRAQGRG
jgi:5-methylthioadenosine/S-adenosylhomocysteine deaminase